MRCPWPTILCAAILAGCTSTTAPRAIQQPAKPVTAYSWQKPNAKVIATGDLQWAPEPFSYRPGKAVRYIDFENGSDDSDGTSRQTPWMHHPWDAAANGKAAQSSDADTYVFKRGVIYRGALDAKESGSVDQPIRLTSDPSWGGDEAMLYGTSIGIRDKSHISISGLSFRFGKIAQQPATIQVMGTCTGIVVSNCTFEPGAFSATPGSRDAVMDYIAFTDNRVEFVDQEAVSISTPGDLRHVQVLRNFVREIDQQANVSHETPELTVRGARFAEIAGNILDLTHGTGMLVCGSQGEGSQEPPAGRILVHHNKVSNSLLSVPDPDGISTCGGGPFYVYNNISARCEITYGADRSFKNYLFNNIGFGRTNGPSGSATNAIKETDGGCNVFANNTFYQFGDGARHQAGTETGRAVRFFVPWGLGDTVGEWHFYCNNANPNRIRDDSWCMIENTGRESTHLRPRYDLQGNSFTAQSYKYGVLEDWCKGALAFNGIDQYLSLPDGELKRPIPAGPEGSGTARMRHKTVDMDTGSFLIEAYLRANPAHFGGAIVSKIGESGYELRVTEDGGLSMMLRSPTQISTVEQALVLKDGKWHHVLVEVDRNAGRVTFYVDGRFVSSGGQVMKDSLSNKADFLVGKNSDGNYFAGEIDFLRICRGTLADAGTTLDELYAWEFDGPQFRDFAGRKRGANKSDAGTIQR